MTQYWIQTPVENCKEVVKRKIDEISGNAGVVVSYQPDCEVVLYDNEWNNWNDDRNAMYFGTFVVNVDAPALTSISIELDVAGNLTVMDWGNNFPNAGEYPYIMFNTLANSSTLLAQSYFIGYKFILTYP